MEYDMIEYDMIELDIVGCDRIRLSTVSLISFIQESTITFESKIIEDHGSER